MKTALQELLDELDLIKIVENHNFFMVKYIIEQCLQKEKEQIIDACNYGLERFGDIAENYYNETYNQNK
jgi:Mg/Co/Ni transporter MgtE